MSWMQQLTGGTLHTTDDRGREHARDFLLRGWTLLRGAPALPVSYALVIVLFLRALSLVYVIAFVSLAVQMLGLYGSQGILPIADFIARQRAVFGTAGIWVFPSVFWLDTSDLFLQSVPIAGALLAGALMLVADRAGLVRRALLVLLFGLYLSIVAAGQDFMSFQWDYLLLEVGFLAIFLGDANVVIWLYRWLLFRLMLLSGLVKILSGDPTWRTFTALDYHFETQPLPNVVGFFVHHLPGSVHQVMVAATFFVELIVPFLIFAPRRLRFAAAGLIALLQVQIFVTGNYNFFNLLTLALGILLFDDAALRGAQTGEMPPPGESVPVKHTRMRWIAYGVAALIFAVSVFQILALFRVPPPGIIRLAESAIEPLRVVNVYGPFAVMTTARPEIVIEGSNDGETWLPYEFRYKPGTLRRAPPWVEPHQPRLDWQMWFAALYARTSDPRALLPSLRSNPSVLFYMQNYGADAWFVNFLARLLEGSAPVLALLDRNPFPQAPPRFVRARLYNYRFAELDAPWTRGNWWVRDERGLYFPALTLGTEAGLQLK